MSKAKFAAAKELIDEKDYVGARAILKSIDHPTAREWETKLDKIQPIKKHTRGSLLIFLILVIAIIAAGWVYLSYTQNQMVQSFEDGYSTNLAATTQYFDAQYTAIFSH